jgi:hypothetical protein
MLSIPFTDRIFLRRTRVHPDQGQASPENAPSPPSLPTRAPGRAVNAPGAQAEACMARMERSGIRGFVHAEEAFAAIKPGCAARSG